MALLYKPLTENEAQKLLADWRNTSRPIANFWSMLQEALHEPTPHFVYYRGARVHRMHHAYVPPTSFYCTPLPKSPSDCVWLVPGTEK